MRTRARVPLEVRQLRRKLEAVGLFLRPRRRGLAAPIVDADPWRRLWQLEGMGYALAGSGRAPCTAPVADEALIPLHMGFGLAVASRALARLDDPGETSRAVQEVEAASRAGSCPGLAGAAFEALGFVARLRRRRRVAEIASAAGRLDARLAALCWHGWGRALFFAPVHVIPCASSGRALARASREPADGRSRANAVAGLAMAMTLVNLSNPELLDAFLAAHAREIPDPEAFGHGVASAVLVWCQSFGRERVLDRFLGYASAAPRLWEGLVQRPAEHALAVTRPMLRSSGQWEALFALAER